MQETVRANAWTGDGAAAVTGQIDDHAIPWALREAGRHIRRDLKPPEAANPGDWTDKRIGWGVVLPATPGLSADDLKTGADASPSIRRLIQARSDLAGWQVPVLRYHPEEPPEVRTRFLKNHRTNKELSIVGSSVGSADHQIPNYLLIAAPPSKVPWEMQYILSAQRLVGRLHLDEDPKHYVDALLEGFTEAESDVRQSVVWAVTHDPGDITHTLRKMITRKIHNLLLEDTDLKAGAVFLDGIQAPATHATLIEALKEKKPALIVTSSHGKTGPLDNVTQMTDDLGLLVDQEFQTLSPDDLLADWSPDGAIWLAHACCSAGSVSHSQFQGLFAPNDPLHELLQGITAVGDTIAPLPQRLLAHEKPARAFIGQVEPTFDWTLKDPDTGQPLTNALCAAVYPNLYRPKPVGLALDTWQDLVDGYNVTWTSLFTRFNNGDDVTKLLLKPRLAACDVQSTVILGDPTAVLPALP